MEFALKLLVTAKHAGLAWVGCVACRGMFDAEHSNFHYGETFRRVLGYPVLAVMRNDTRDVLVATKRTSRHGQLCEAKV